MATTAMAPVEAGRAPLGSRTRSAYRWRRRLPLLPALVFTIVVTQIPFLVTIFLSLLKWNTYHTEKRHFVWLDNYVTVFTDERLRGAVVHTIELTASVVVVSVLIGLGLAILLDRRFLGRGLARTLLIAPFLITPAAADLLWKHSLYDASFGLLNGIPNWFAHLFGKTGPTVTWIPSYPMPSLIAALVWQWTPFMMLILLAGLQAQPGDILEAARVDGASGLQMFRYLTLPHLRQYIELAVLLGTMYIVQNFDAVYTITQGGPGTATDTLPYEIYQTMFHQNEYGQAAADGVVVVFGTIIVATFALRTISSLFREEISR